jgi:hypothetical protein
MPLHPTEHKDHRFAGQVLAGIGAAVVLIAATADDNGGGGLAVAGFIIGIFLLVCSVAYFGVHALGTLMRDHELWRRGLDQGGAEE